MSNKAHVMLKGQMFFLPASFGEGEVRLSKLMETKKGVFALGVIAGQFPYITSYLQTILERVEPIDSVQATDEDIHGPEPDARLPGGRSNHAWIKWYRAVNGTGLIETKSIYESKFGSWR